MKTIKISLEITFNDHIVTEQYPEITTKVINALIHEVESGNGLAPESAETFTTHIKVNDNIYKPDEHIFN